MILGLPPAIAVAAMFVVAYDGKRRLEARFPADQQIAVTAVWKKLHFTSCDSRGFTCKGLSFEYKIYASTRFDSGLSTTETFCATLFVFPGYGTVSVWSPQ